MRRDAMHRTAPHSRSRQSAVQTAHNPKTSLEYTSRTGKIGMGYVTYDRSVIRAQRKKAPSNATSRKKEIDKLAPKGNFPVSTSIPYQLPIHSQGGTGPVQGGMGLVTK